MSERTKIIVAAFLAALARKTTTKPSYPTGAYIEIKLARPMKE